MSNFEGSKYMMSDLWFFLRLKIAFYVFLIILLTVDADTVISVGEPLFLAVCLSEITLPSKVPFSTMSRTRSCSAWWNFLAFRLDLEQSCSHDVAT